MKYTRLIAGVVATLFLWPLTGCRDPKQAAQARAGGPNVLLITLDTTRADHLGCYDYPHAATPALDALARQGVRFTQAFAQAPITLTSHAVLLTGTYPPENGVRDNGRFALGSGLPTLAEVFRRHGYRTGAFLAAQVLNSRFGLARGFDVYDENLPQFQRPAKDVCDVALAWLQQPSDKPFFAWVHFYDPHWPYAPPKEYLDKTVNPYDGEIAFMDAHVGRLTDWLRTRDLLKSTLVVAVGDHGESLGEHGYNWHALLVYDSLMRVPLIVSWPGRLPQNTAPDGLVRMADIMPTILQLLGREIPREVSGQSFLPALEGQALPARQSYGESDFPYYGFGWSKLRCLIEQKWKYIRAPEVELYDRVNDPGELQNLAGQHPEQVQRLEEELAAWEQRLPQRQSAPVTLDEQNIAALQALGYVGAPAPATQPTARLKNPKDLVDIANDVRMAESHLVAAERLAQQPDKLAEAVKQTLEILEHMEPAAERSPESFLVMELVGRAYAGVGMHGLAQDALRQALAIQPDSPDTWVFLARVQKARGGLTPAIEACERALQYQPNHVPAKQLLPEFRQLLGEQQARIAELRAQLRADPASVEVGYNLGELLVKSGQPAEGIRILRAALAGNPDHAALTNALAWRLATSPEAELRDGAEAVRLARQACSGALADSPDALDTLAAALAEAGQFDEAVETAQRAAKLAEEQNDSWLVAVLARRLKYYESKRPFHLPE